MARPSFKRHRFPPEIIQHAAWLYFRFTLSFRDVEELLAQRGIGVSYETVRYWAMSRRNSRADATGNSRATRPVGSIELTFQRNLIRTVQKALLAMAAWAAVRSSVDSWRGATMDAPEAWSNNGQPRQSPEKRADICRPTSRMRIAAMFASFRADKSPVANWRQITPRDGPKRLSRC